MGLPVRKLSASAHSRHAEIESRWEESVAYYQKRGGVVFISYCKFWEKHGFVQQSLAYALAVAGVKVVWFDGSGWKPSKPVVEFPHPNLQVRQLPSLPGRRFAPIREKNIQFAARSVQKAIRSLGNPVIWVEAGLADEELVNFLPQVDVFAVFDDPYRHSPSGLLCQAARCITTQNKLAYELMLKEHPKKTFQFLPPMEVNSDIFHQSFQWKFPPNFPMRTMGYIGSIWEDGFDFPIFEDFIRSFPDWGFILAGRTDERGLQRVETLRKQYSNFIHFPWVERNTLADLWTRLDVTLLLYKHPRVQDGAFATKALESLYFGVPCVGTLAPKNQDLSEYFPISAIPDVLKRMALQMASKAPEYWDSAYEKLAHEMDPKRQLCEIADFLKVLTTF